MANEEGVKIIITAEDRFSETMKKIDASSKIFGETTKNTQRNLEALEKEMIRLVANGLDPADTKIKEMKANYDKLSQSLNGGDASLKKSNQQWTNLALVIQDLPYGFRGIQNNLPALIGGFAGVSGAAYVLGSALIAIWTAYGDTITEVIFKTNSLDKANKQLQEGMVESVKSTSSAREELFKVAAVIKAGKDNLIDKSAALDYYNKQLGTTFGAATTLEEAEAKMIEKTPKYIESLGLKAKAQFYYAKAAEYAIKGDLAGLEDQTTAFDKLIAFGKAFQGITALGPKQLIRSIVASLSVAQNKAIDKIANQSQLIGDILFKNGNDAMNQYFKGLKAAGLSDEEIADIFKKFQAARDKALIEKDVKTLEDPNIKLLEAKKQYYKDDLLMSASYEQEILAAKRDLAVRQAELEKKDGEYIQIIKDTYNQLIINSQKNTANEIIKIQHKLGVDDAKEYEKNTKEKLALDKKSLSEFQRIYDEQIEYVSQFYKDKMNMASGDKLKQLSILNEQQAYWDEYFDYSLMAYEDWSKKTGEITKNKVSLENALIKESFDFLMQLGNGIMSALGPSLDMLLSKGASIGDVLKKAFDDLLKQLIKVTVAAAIAVALIAILFPGTLAKAGGALKLFGGLFSQGMGLGKDMFAAPTAKGGVFSGPSYRLVGEYPGAKTNPEVVAPLDKLKSMMGGGGGSGEFVLRGNDLVLAMQRSNSSLKLRRG